MNKKIVFLVLFVISIGYVSAQTLTVRIENVTIDKGYLMTGIFNDEETFPNSYFKGDRTAASDSVIEIVFEDLPIGQYTVSVYQDSNNNGELDTGVFGIPKEKYGFSNDARRPSFSRCLFSFDKNMTITIQIR